MKYSSRLALGLGVTLLSLPALAACDNGSDSASGSGSASHAGAHGGSASGGGSQSGGGGYGAAKPSGPSSATAASGAVTTADSPLGRIVVDGKGMTAYFYDKDKPGSGKSACTGGCLAEWPPVMAQGDKPEVKGVKAEVGTIDAPGGGKQLTLDGSPVYTYAADQKPGDVTGQGAEGIWWVIDTSGHKVTAKAK